MQARVHGYDNQDVRSETGHRLHVIRVVNQAEAAIVRQIYEMYAGGLGSGRIAKRLNTEGITAPRKSLRGWAPTAIREILYRPLYQGKIVWNKLQKFDQGGTKKRRRRDEKDWVPVDAPDLRIIPPELWASVQARLAKKRQHARFSFRDQESKYLLTGMARCASCGGPMQIIGQNYHRKKGRYYGCSYFKNRGSAICKNSLLVEQDVLDQIVLKSIQEALTDDLIRVAVEKALAKHRAGEGAKLDRRTAIERELSLIAAKKEHLVDSIATGDKDPTILARLRTEEARRQGLVRELEALDATDQVIRLDDARLKRELNARLADMNALLGRNIPGARQLLGVLLEEPLCCESVQEGDRKAYRITGTGNYLPLLPEPWKSLNSSESNCSVVLGVPNGKHTTGHARPDVSHCRSRFGRMSVNRWHGFTHNEA